MLRNIIRMEYGRYDILQSDIYDSGDGSYIYLLVDLSRGEASAFLFGYYLSKGMDISYTDQMLPNEGEENILPI